MSAHPTSLHWQPAYGGDGFAVAYDDLRQAIRTILSTRVGSDPLRPDFGSRVPDYLDWPIDRARPHIVRETVAAIRKWEPRLAVKRVRVAPAEDNPAQLVVAVHFIAADGVEVSAEVRP
ncbi:GPW/gp25 family protein [Thiofaba sp. EF100]|uniref:GPW/gp25 family protein n=1 Tax=Thiofaba sp. EF100 TaxID=3121274 RepID=UPI003221A700